MLLSLNVCLKKSRLHYSLCISQVPKYKKRFIAPSHYNIYFILDAIVLTCVNNTRYHYGITLNLFFSYIYFYNNSLSRVNEKRAAANAATPNSMF